MRRSVPTLLEWGKALHQPVSNQSPFRPLAPIEGGFRIGKTVDAQDDGQATGPHTSIPST